MSKIVTEKQLIVSANKARNTWDFEKIDELFWNDKIEYSSDSIKIGLELIGQGLVAFEEEFLSKHFPKGIITKNNLMLVAGEIDEIWSQPYFLRGS